MRFANALLINRIVRPKKLGHDEAGRALSFVIIDGVGMHYWVDDAVCSVIIVKIVTPRR